LEIEIHKIWTITLNISFKDKEKFVFPQITPLALS
jgi:hypothetical protein